MYEEGRGGLPKSSKKASELNHLAADAPIGPALQKTDNPEPDAQEGKPATLHAALEENDVELIKQFKNLEELDEEGDTPLVTAVRRANPKQAQLLSSMGAIPNNPNSSGERPLLLAAASCDILSTQYLLSAGADPSLSGPDGDLALHAALMTGCEEFVPLLLQAHVDVNQAGSDGQIALHFAVMGLNPEGTTSARDMVVKSLLNDRSRSKALGLNMFASVLENTTSVNTPEKTGLTPLMIAVYLAGRSNVMRSPQEDNLLKAITLLLSKGADVNAVDSDGNTALILASESDCSACIELLIGKGAQISHRNNNGSTAIGEALRERATIKLGFEWPEPGLDTLRALLRAGASLIGDDALGLAPVTYAMWDAPSDSNKTSLLSELLQVSNSDDVLLRHIELDRNQIALFAAAALGDSAKLTALIATGASVNAKTPEGVTPLAFAVFEGNAEIVELLIKAGADPNISSEVGLTPLMLAVRFGEVNIVGDLLRAHADTASRNSWGETALHLAIPPKPDDWRQSENRNQERDEYITALTSLRRIPRHSDGMDLYSETTSDLRRRYLLSGRMPDDYQARTIAVAELLVKANADVEASAANRLSPLGMACDSEQWACAIC